MGISKKKAAENRRAIVETATRLFRERGVDAVGVNELMRQAGFTHGGFYNHFASKEALVAEVVCEAMGNAAPLPARACADLADRGGMELALQVETYLSKAHRDDLSGCAIASLVGDVRRMSEEAQRHFVEGLRAVLARLTPADGQKGAECGDRRERAIALYCQMIGALVLSRAAAGTDRPLADEILSAGKADLTERMRSAGF